MNKNGNSASTILIFLVASFELGATTSCPNSTATGDTKPLYLLALLANYTLESSECAFLAATIAYTIRYGYSIHGKPLTSKVMLVRGERVSAIACISISGLLDVMTVKGIYNKW